MIILHVSAQSETSLPTACNFPSPLLIKRSTVCKVFKREVVQAKLKSLYHDSTLFVCIICLYNSLAATFPSGPATEQTLDVRFRTTATWIFAIAQFLVVRDHWGDTQQVLLSQGKWKLLIYAPASDLLLVCCVNVSVTPCASRKMPLGEFDLI